MRVILVTSDLRGQSGWSRYALDLGKALQAQGVDVRAFVAERSHKPWCEEYLLPFPPHKVSHPLLCVATALVLRRTLKRLKPDIVHFVAEPYALTLPFLGKRRLWRACMTIHGSYTTLFLGKRGFRAWCAREAYRRMDRVFSVSNFTKQRLLQRDPAFATSAHLAEKIVVLPNAVTLSQTVINREQRTRGERKYLIGVGAVKARKGYLEAVEACAIFRRRYARPFLYDIIGSLTEDPPYVEKLRQRIKDYSLHDAIRLRGLLTEEELQRAYAEADLFFLLPQELREDVEGFGIVFLEANAWDIPVIGSWAGGCPEAIQNGVSGYVCNPLDAEEVAERMSAILIRGTIDQAHCHQWAEEHRIEQSAEKLIHYYEELSRRA